MSLNCPNCGAHLTVALAEDSTATSAAAAAPRRKKLVLAKNAGSHDVNPTDADLQRLKQIMCFPFNTSVRWKPTQPTMRSVVSDKQDEVGILKDCRARQTSAVNKSSLP
ncbi:hypothetical protein C8A00DRAFT_36486, partial [Chaetomidium leptoderma]